MRLNTRPPRHRDFDAAATREGNRMRALLVTDYGNTGKSITTGDLIVNLDMKTVAVAGARVHLTGKEYQVLELLSLRKGTTLSKQMFLNRLYDGVGAPNPKIIDVFICNLRRKLAIAGSGKNYIQTVRGRGYALRTSADDTS